jgi:hypothetical protein
MKVLDLQCRQGHSFEGWFGSQDDYDAQRARGLVTCPMCNDSEVTKMLSAPRLNLGHGVPPPVHSLEAAPASASDRGAALPAPATSSTELPSLVQMQAAVMSMVRHVIANTEDVGKQFAEEARKIHYGETQERNIRGQATREETEALLDEGIDVMALPVPESLKGPLQ